MYPGLPEKQGLYDPQFEHDSCGVGFLVDLKGRKSHRLVRDSLRALENLAHQDRDVDDGGRIAGPMLGAYHASKFAMEGLTDTLRQELAQWGIKVVSIEPGAIATPIWETGANTADRLLAQMPAQAQEYYGAAMQGARAFAAQASKTGLPPERVAEVIEQALTAPKPRTRYPVGTDAKIGTRILAHLPDSLRDRMLARRR
jgi:NAD(P)-dependent dehydrogenase (short-subunit alcohol dehydrogenase family)